MKSAFVLVASVLTVVSVRGQFLQDGQCDPSITLQSNFNADQFSGPWYEIARSDNPSQQGQCSTLTLSGSNTNTYALAYNAVSNSLTEVVTGAANYESGTARYTLDVGTINNLDFWILGTNYNDYAIAYSCVNVNATNRYVYLWHYGRETTINSIFNNIMNNIVTPLGVTLNDLTQVDHSENACFALPIIPAGEPVVIPGQCDPNISPLADFNPALFLGTWHEIYSYYSESVVGTCGRAEYSSGDGVVNVINSEVINQTLSVIPGTAAVVDGFNARLLVTLEVQPNVFISQDLWVIDTDYTSYAISYSCINVNTSTKRVFSWIAGRSPQLSAESLAAVNSVVDSILDLNFIYYQESSRSEDDCFYFPEPASDQIVEFRGECDLSIPAHPNFDPVAYMGLWHDIASYPSGFQEGTCNNALYTLLPGPVVDVFNTQVVDETLDVMRGTAIPVSTDGSAKLEVTFPVAGTNFTISTSYWVLATDYINYALVYTCQYNSETDMRQVWSWKLSRTKALTEASNTAINNVIANIPVLDDRYYITRDQTPEGCFYYPEPQQGVPVVFPGQCNESIPAVANFNLASFQGSWYEVETYPKEESGDCVQHVYGVGDGNTLNLVSSFNIEQFLQTSSSVLRFSSTDNSAKFIIAINTGNNTVIEMPFWILSIDANYNDYALAYSCMNIDTDYRAVYSWKLSRSQELSAAGQTAITNFITSSNITVLDNRYFEPVDQSDYACASLPEIAEGQPIILDGQCDLNIAVVQNFAPGRYVGLWHLIETYPSAFQNGDCNDATYTAQADGSVLVFNTQVVNQTLDTITGTATLATTDGSGILDVIFPDSPTIQYWVIDTDYDSYSLVYSCINITATTQQIWAWKLSRTKSLTENAANAINESMRDVRVLNNRYFYTVDNTDAACFYFPEPNGQPVTFRGQCDESIPVVTNFDAVGYEGLWYDIESYPQFFQDGTCSTALYTLNDGGVDVFNTQVINQTLDTIVGRAELIPTTDGSAKLNVSFVLPGTNITVFSPYWVLNTDYTNYAFVYSCQNIDADSRLVSSWKLSRERTLSTAAQTAINNVIGTIDVLSEQYYEVQGHTDEQCFYLPEPTGEPVVFRGQCDNNIAAVPNFDVAQFAGIWNEIETYPKEQAGGQCINHEFTTTTAANTLLLTSNQVFDSETLVSNDGQIVLSSTDGSGRFQLSINVNNETIVMPYWVLATDYSSYALVYSCMNLNSETRAVYSWKLSRTSELSNNANTAISSVITAVDVLYQQYFETVRQDDDACFYLPELGANEIVILPGQCNQSIPVVQNFSPGDYVGLWHLIESYPSAFQDGQCNDATYTAQADGSVLVFNTQVVNQTLDTITGVATVASTDGSAKLLVSFPDAPVDIEYWVIATDYVSYSLVYSCLNLSDNRQQIWSWKMSRTRSLTANATTAINNSMQDIRVLSDRYFYTIDNTDAACFYFPEPNGQPVTFRGQCDESIPVVTNFDAVGYEGLWYDIESYPQFFQDGTCSTALYTLNDGGVDVFNTQVINQTLDTIVGRAELIPTTDGSAKLNVSFVLPGTNITVFSPYWVLNTDYTNYAFVYSCQNIDADSRLVSSWKLSRERTLSTAAQTAINNVIGTIDVLSEQYYEVQGHTDEQCFYLPEPTGEPVVFRGQCDNNIAAVPNFDVAQFAGIWNEIETYPKEQAGGQCINHEFTTTTAANTLLLTSNQVFDSETLVSNDGQIVLSSTDGSGRFQLSINVNNETIVMPYWVLATDYSSYALVYSCMNLDSETRAVYSWKLSRTSELSNNANTAISSVITAVDVLDQQYFETVRQDDDACFYLPELGANEIVILPGQCNQSIPVVQNFSPGDYVGLWHLIESYPSAFQDGQCNDATYTAQADGSVLVFNTQVVNQTLDTITGVATVASTDGSAKLLVSFPDAPVDIEYWVIATDYVSYSLVYSCLNLSDNRQQIWSWKMSRTRSLSANATTAINNSMQDIRVLSDRYFYTIDNTDAACFYFPEPNGQPVIFRGQCDESIPVVTNFDAVGYEGLWYDLESYPQFFQDGTCSTALYTLRDGGVDVFNTQVINQTLDTIVGRAELIPTTDGSAKLNVSFILPGTNLTVFSPYWVLDTDYTNYAFVYSCQNIDDSTRFVSSWKLSRQRTLSTAAQTAISNVIATIDVLSEQYYEVQGHTDEQCFYLPEPTGEPVVFRGQCDNNIAAVPNFDVAQFAGIWNELETYPKEQAGGQCIHHEFTTTTAANTLLLTSNQVFDSETLVSNDGQIVLSSTDGSGRFQLSINVNNQTIVMPYWVLATDYSTYALVYSCVNLDSESRAVYSWKLSRSGELTNAANTAINSIINSVDVLDQQYYETVRQDDQACFFLPDIGLDEPAIFIGVCDSNIPVVQNFAANRFAGRWFDIESYYDEYQGNCSEGIFNIAGNGFDVVLAQVVNEALDTTASTATVAADNSGRLIVTTNNVTYEYYILGTDYDTYSLIYSCQNVGNNQRRVRSWKLSRTRQLAAQASVAINAIINNTDVLNERFFIVRNHSDAACFYYPIPDGQPVRFRGRCDQNIPVVDNFDAGSYLGTWYDIESYPQAFQDGQCATANYSPGLDGAVDVFNTQVVNQQLDTMSGVAVSINGTARLEVTFFFPGDVTVTTPYWILATDYNNFAFVYSCSELDDEYRSVAAWKLSRTRSLTAAAETTINNIMSTIPVLRQEYYRPIGHSEEDCFFYPDNNGGPVILDGQCPESSQIDAIANFNPTGFSGTWHEVSRFPSELQNGECASSEFAVNAQGLVSLTQNIVLNETLLTFSGNGSLAADSRGVISAVFTNAQGSSTSLDTYILDTDYSEFALLYSCRNIDNSSKQIYSWKLGRSRAALSQAANDRIDSIVSSNVDLFELYYETTRQDNDACFFYPEFDVLPEAIELPGPCTYIPGMPNFNSTAYLGRWIELARFPQPSQSGTCSRAEYSLGNDTINVFNTQVLNQTLFTQIGSAVPISNEGRGELLVTFVVNGVENQATYYVLGTDYSNYALVYNCRNLTNGNRQVFSWKLSRERTLSAASNQAIDNIIDNTQGLRESFYMSTSQSDEDCFYLPEPNPESDVVVRGQCGNITGVPNFNINNYLGNWHEIQRYPTGQDDGECISAEFSSTGTNQYQVVDKTVRGYSAETFVNQVTVTADGRIRRTMTVDGVTDVSDVWVVSTDYNNYAVLYSCVEIDSEYRRVWSAIHSRNRTLPEASQTAVNQTIANYDVLDQRYYLDVDQSDSACFYYPEPTGEPVTLPGQCDEDIPVVENFSIVEYTHEWFQIERYPQSYETGNCTGARYTLNEETGIVNVLNWEVIDGELDTIEGTAVPLRDDGSGRFLVTLPSRVVEGTNVTQNLYVLATDYINYALTYSCFNINQNQRRVAVWKLSRYRTLTAASATAINAVMNQRPELDQRYFISVGQSDECPKPNTSVIVQSSIILLFICSLLQLLNYNN